MDYKYGPPDYLKMMCFDCAEKLKIEDIWEVSDLRSNEGLCQWCWKDDTDGRTLAEVDMRKWETKNILARSW